MARVGRKVKLQPSTNKTRRSNKGKKFVKSIQNARNRKSEVQILEGEQIENSIPKNKETNEIACTRKRKLDLFKSNPRSDDEGAEKRLREGTNEDDGRAEPRSLELEKKTSAAQYRLYKDDIWNTLLQGLKCKSCGKSGLTAKHTFERGFACIIQIRCTFCDCINNECHSCPNENGTPEVNRLMTNAFLDMGAGYSGMQKFGLELNTNIPSHNTFALHVHKTHTEVTRLCEKILQKSREIVRQKHLELSAFEDESGVLNIPVSYDGSWHTKGHSSNQGLGIVIDILTGLVIDYVVLSKNCAACNAMESKLKDCRKRNEWMEKHQRSGNCEKNFDGSSGAMEVTAAEILWKRSIQKCKMRYIILLSDGDCKTFTHLISLNVYPGWTIEKQECINHIGKRLYTALQKVVENCKVKGITLGGAKTGSLTIEKTRTLQGYYTGAIRKNAPNVKSMQTAILATLHHCSSTDRRPNHKSCPKGEKSWCFWQRAKAMKEKPPSHSQMTCYIRADVVKHIKPEYVRLSDPDLLERCTEIGTQNANESLHNSIWLKCPKNKNASRKKVEIAVSKAVSEFNAGRKEMLKFKFEEKGQVKEVSLAIAERCDRQSISRSARRNTETSRYARKLKKRRKKLQNAKKRRKKALLMLLARLIK